MDAFWSQYMNPSNSPQGGSLLDEILASANTPQPQAPTPTPGGTPPPAGNTPTPENPPPKKPRSSMDTATVFKLIGTLFLVGLIFFGTFLAYIVFNPSQAGFFITVFGIDPNDIAALLKTLINASFGVLTAAISVVFIITLFQAIWTKKELKRKKLMSTIMAILSGILLFTVMTFWAYLFAKIGETDFTNPGGNILVYDNDVYVQDEYRQYARLSALNNLIGPISLRYDISQNAKQMSNIAGGEITAYKIDFNGAKCMNGTSIVSGTNPLEEKGIVCLFDENKVYTPQGNYTILLRTGEEKSVSIPLAAVEIRGLIEISEAENKDGQLIRTFDAKRIKNLGSPRWIRINEDITREIPDIISLVPTEHPVPLGLKVLSKTSEFDRLFIIHSNNNNPSEGNISVVQNTANPQEYTFTLHDISQNSQEIISIDWELSNGLKICNDKKSESCSYIFTSYGEWRVTATVNLAGNNTETFHKTFRIDPPLELERHVKVTNRTGKLLNEEDTFDRRIKTYVIRDIFPPETLIFDARDVIADNPGYLLKSVKWTISDGKSNENRTGDKIEFTVNRTARYHISAEYTFEKSIKTGREDDVRKAYDTIMLDLERKNLTPILKVTPDSGYVPIKITVDASQSRSEYSEIVKFEFDFGEGKPKTIGDAVQTYEYLTSGEKKITVTAIDANNARATTTQTIVLKDTPKTVDFTTSISPGVMGKWVDFTATNSTGQIERFMWNFGDNTPIEHGYSVTHTFQEAGVYTVTLTAKYLDGTERSTSQLFTVVESLE